MGLFKKEEDTITPVPVYTIPQVNRNFEAVGTVAVEVRVANGDPNEPLNVIGRLGSKMGADAVVGLQMIYAGHSGFATCYGTAIKYLAN